MQRLQPQAHALPAEMPNGSIERPPLVNKVLEGYTAFLGDNLL